ncbi:MAG: hypothetical protein ACKO4U_14435 [Caldilinea sp.]
MSLLYLGLLSVALALPGVALPPLSCCWGGAAGASRRRRVGSLRVLRQLRINLR